VESKDILYSDLKEKLEGMVMPKTLIFCGGSAYSSDIKYTVFNVLIPKIEFFLRKKRTEYETSEMKLAKDRLFQIYVALENENNWNIDLDSWRDINEFSSYKLK